MAPVLLLIHLLALSEVVIAEASTWTAKLPSTVTGLPGSCVVIPCFYSYPSSTDPITQFNGIWMDASNTVVFHSDRSQVHQSFKGRTELVGDISQNNCSLKIEPLNASDLGPFHFRIEMKGHNSYSYRENVVSISMQSQLPPISFTLEESDEKSMTASCMVSHSCPSSPPVFTWSHAGVQQSYPHQLSDGMWTLTSVLTFHPTYLDHQKTLQCTVTYRGGQQQNNSKTLEVKYAPLTVTVDKHSLVREGGSALLRCSSDSNPPADRFLWFNVTGELLSSGENYTIANISRHFTGVYCEASNTEGSRNSSLVRLSVSYAPEIKPVSRCYVHQTVVRCECIVASCPPSTVHFLVLDKVVRGKVKEYGGITMATLDTDLVSSGSVACQAENMIGRSSTNLSAPENRNTKTIFIIAFASGAAIFVVVFTAALRKCLKRSSNQMTSQRNPAASSTPNKQVFFNASRSNENVYRNTEEEMYMEADGEGIYANM